MVNRYLIGTLVATSAVLLTACNDTQAGPSVATSTTSSQPTSSSVPATTTRPAGDPPGTECEKVVMTAAEQPAYVFIREGTVVCDEATRVMQDYYLMLQRGQAPGSGGGGPVQVRDWTCASGPATDPGSVCTTADGRRIEAEVG